MHEHERFQTNCQYCAKTLEGDSATESILLAEAHEKECEKNPHRLLIEGQLTTQAAQTTAPSSFCITTDDAREIVRITAKGEVIVNPVFTTDEAALAFWEAVRKVAARGGAQ